MVNATTTTNPRDVTATLQFITPTSKFNRRYMCPKEEVNTGIYEEKQVLIKDARNERENFTLDNSGFQLVDHKSDVEDFMTLITDFTGKTRNDTYENEIAELLKELTGADKVITFGVVVRQTKPSGTNYQPPAGDVHIDWTPKRAHFLAQDLLSKSSDPEYKYSAFKCINLWRAISPAPQDYPLAVCHGYSLTTTCSTANQMILVDKIPDFSKPEEMPDGPVVSEADLFPYSEDQKWYYFSDMKKEEILAFTLYDSEKGEKGRCPHTAFNSAMEGAHPRESVEIRSVVYYK